MMVHFRLPLGSHFGVILESILESFWRPSGVHFGDILESILERKIDLSGTERIFSNAGVLLYCSFGAAGVLHWGHSNASFPNATHRLAGHAAARRKPSARPPPRGCVQPRQALSHRAPQRNNLPANALLSLFLCLVLSRSQFCLKSSRIGLN